VSPLPIRHPVADFSWPTDPTINAIFTIGAGIAVLGGLVASYRYYRREGTVVGFVCMIGGAVASLIEPMTGANAFVYYPRQEQWTLFTAYDVRIPAFLTLAYAAEIGLGALATWRLLRAGAGPTGVLRVWAVVALGDLLLETPALWLHVFYYYGPQPWSLWGFPLYWAPLDGALGILPAVALHLLHRPGWRPRHYLVTITLFPTSVALFYFGAGWPLWTLMHTDLPEPWMWLGGAITVALACLFVRALAALSTLPPSAVEVMRTATWSYRSALPGRATDRV
jgi:hypothetical protein